MKDYIIELRGNKKVVVEGSKSIEDGNLYIEIINGYQQRYFKMSHNIIQSILKRKLEEWNIRLTIRKTS